MSLQPLADHRYPSSQDWLQQQIGPAFVVAPQETAIHKLLANWKAQLAEADAIWERSTRELRLRTLELQKALAPLGMKEDCPRGQLPVAAFPSKPPEVTAMSCRCGRLKASGSELLCGGCWAKLPNRLQDALQKMRKHNETSAYGMWDTYGWCLLVERACDYLDGKPQPGDEEPAQALMLNTKDC